MFLCMAREWGVRHLLNKIWHDDDDDDDGKEEGEEEEDDDNNNNDDNEWLMIFMF